MTKCGLLTATAVAASLLLRAEETNELAIAAAADVARAVHPCGTDGENCWTLFSEWFMHPPALPFQPAKGAVRYRFTVLDDLQHPHVFTAKSSNATLEPVWKDLPVGFFSVFCEAFDAGGKSLGLMSYPSRPNYGGTWSGGYSYWKLAPFEPGKYPKAKCGYREAAARVYDWIFNHSSTRVFLETGRPDAKYFLSTYPSKLHGALAPAMVRYARLRPDRAAEAMRLARLSADYLLSVVEPAGTPLAGFTPTYGTGVYAFGVAKAKAGQTMIMYPASGGEAFLALFEATCEAKYRAAAVATAERYLALQEADGSWPLLLDIRTGEALQPNRVHPVDVMQFLEKVFALTGETKYRAAADRASVFVKKGPWTNFNWEGQFEDVDPSKRYANLSMHPPCKAAVYFLSRYPDDAQTVAEAAECVRFAEDQFVLWERPCRADGKGVRTDRLWWKNPKHPSVDYPKMYHFPNVTEQFRWNVPIDASMARLVEAWMAIWRTTGDRLCLAKATAMADSLVNAQLPSGRIPTEMVEGNLKHDKGDWLNCMIFSARTLEAFADAIGEKQRR